MQHPLTDIPGIECWRIDGGRGDIRVTITRERPPAPTAAVEAEWARRVALNPMLHDGGVLSVLGFDAETNAIAARRDTYKRLAVQPRVPTGVRLLAVTAVLRAVDAAGASYALLGRRSHRTRIYGGRWELGPSGGVGLPPPAVEQMGLSELCEHLIEEVREEAGLRVHGPGVPVAFLPRLFERFARAEGQSHDGGSGLGLSLSRALARGMGGDLWHSPTPGGGATFTIWVPAVRPEVRP